MYPTVLFDDGDAGIAPLADLRPAYDLRTGVLTTRERVAARLQFAGLIPAAAHTRLAQEATPALVVDDRAQLPPAVFLLSARAPLAWRLAMVLRPGQMAIDPLGGGLIAAVTSHDRIAPLLAGDRTGFTQVLVPPRDEGDRTAMMLTRPWHVRSMRDACIAEDLELLMPRFEAAFGWAQLPPGSFATGLHRIALHNETNVGPMTLFDTTAGPILIDEGATIRPGAQIIGPCAVLAHATVLERATIRPGSVIGPWCKVNGEVGGTIFQGFSNKAHDGYLGDSFVGEWVNLGAGTTNSNLLNTYGEVIAKAAPDARNERTGEQFLGAIIGDHVKTAICTRIMTGSVLHTGAMIATTAPASGCIEPFAWCTDEGRRTYRLDKFVEVVRAAMARRKLTPSPAYLARLSDFHAASAAPREGRA